MQRRHIDLLRTDRLQTQRTRSHSSEQAVYTSRGDCRWIGRYTCAGFTWRFVPAISGQDCARVAPDLPAGISVDELLADPRLLGPVVFSPVPYKPRVVFDKSVMAVSAATCRVSAFAAVAA